METLVELRWQGVEGIRKMFKRKTPEEKLKETEEKLVKDKAAADKAHDKELKDVVPDGKSEVVDTPIEPIDDSFPDVSKPELTEEEKAKLDEIRDYKLAEIKEYQEEYGDFFTPNDMANISVPVLTAEQMNLLYAQFSETKKLRKLIEKMN